MKKKYLLGVILSTLVVTYSLPSVGFESFDNFKQRLSEFNRDPIDDDGDGHIQH